MLGDHPFRNVHNPRVMRFWPQWNVLDGRVTLVPQPDDIGLHFSQSAIVNLKEEQEAPVYPADVGSDRCINYGTCLLGHWCWHVLRESSETDIDVSYLAPSFNESGTVQATGHARNSFNVRRDESPNN